MDAAKEEHSVENVGVDQTSHTATVKRRGRIVMIWAKLTMNMIWTEVVKTGLILGEKAR